MGAYKGLVTTADYTFNSAAKTITFSSNYNGLVLSDINYITNIKYGGKGTVIYDPTDTTGTVSGTLSGLVLTLTYDTSAMSNSDDLQIIIGMGSLPLLVSGTISFTPSGTQDTNLKQVGGTSFSLGQQLAAASLPIVLTAAQLTTLTPPAAITGYATSANQTNASQKTQIVDGSGNVIASTSNALNVAIVSGGGSAANVGATGSAVPASAGYGGINVAGTLRGQTGVNPSGSIYATQVDVASVAGTTLDTNSGNKSAGTIRVVLATDQPQLTNKLLVTADAITFASPQHVIIDSGTITAVTAITNALPAGTNVIGHVIVDSGTITTVSTVTTLTGGGVASGATDSGNPVKVGGIYNSSPISLTTGQRGDLQVDTNGYLKVNVVAGSTGNAAASATGSAVPASADYVGLNVAGNLRGQTGVNPSGSIYAGQVDLASIAGTTASVSSGNKDNGTLRVTLATDQVALTNSLPVKSTQKPSFSSTVVLAVTALQSMTSSATVGWKSVRTSVQSSLANDYEVFVSLTTANTSPANDKAMYVYIIAWYTSDAGTTWYASSGGTATLPTSADATYTIAAPHNFKLIGVLNYTTAQMTVQDTFLLSNCFGNRLPDGFSIFIENFSGATLSTGCIVNVTPINDTLT